MSSPVVIDPAAWERSVERDFREVLANDVVVRNALDRLELYFPGRRPVDLRAVVCVLSKRLRELQAEINHLRQLHPRRYSLPDGRVVRWDPPDDVISVEKVG